MFATHQSSQPLGLAINRQHLEAIEAGYSKLGWPCFIINVTVITSFLVSSVVMTFLLVSSAVMTFLAVRVSTLTVGVGTTFLSTVIIRHRRCLTFCAFFVAKVIGDVVVNAVGSLFYRRWYDSLVLLVAYKHAGTQQHGNQEETGTCE